MIQRLSKKESGQASLELFLALLLLPLSLFFLSCEASDIGSSTSTSSVDNSVDNSLNGISKCTDGTTLTCREVGAGSFSVTRECVNGDGSSVILDGPDIEESLPDQCFVPEPTE
jgi:hypothetical protein